MDFIIDFYKKLITNEQVILKEIINEFIDYQKNIEKNKGKISIKSEKINEINKKSISIYQKAIKEELKKDLNKEINLEKIEKQIIEEVMIKGYNKKTIAIFSIYKGETNEINDKLFTYRRDIIDLLNKNNIINISKINLSNEFKKINNGEYEEEMKELANLQIEELNKAKETYGEDIIENDIKTFENASKKIEIIIFDIKIIEKLLNEFEIIDSKQIIYKDNCLSYNGLHYPLQKNSQRDIFIKLFFSSDKKDYTIKEIIEIIENGAGNFYDEKNRKKILDLYKSINKTIEKKLGIKKLFYLGKGLEKGNIYINR